MKPKCLKCGKPVLPGEEFCSGLCSGSYKRSGSLVSLIDKGMLLVSVKAIEFSPAPDSRGPTSKNRPIMWEARVSTLANGDVTARRKSPDEALRDAMAAFTQHKKPVKRPDPDDDGMDLI